MSGNLRAQARIEKLKPKLAEEGIDPARLRLEWISATEGKNFQQVIQEMAERNCGGKGEKAKGKRRKGERRKVREDGLL